MKPLTIGIARGKTFTLPLELATLSLAILAKRGVGKSYAAAVLAEELHGADVPPVIIDPTGAHWGLKASADGKQDGLKFVVFGGEHADLPLEEGAGEVIARAIVEHRFAAIIDLSLFRKGQMHRFLVGFFEALYRLNRQAIHLICDECDVYAPQKPFGEEARTLGAMQDIVRRGRIRGLGCTLISQRPQVVNKDVLTQCEVLVTMRLIHPKDIRAIEEWIAVHGDPEKAKQLIASLPSLEVGFAWFWCPSMELFEKVQIRLRRTFDSSATPKPGQRVVAPERLAAVDLSKLGADIEASAQRAKENDPRALKTKISVLHTEIAKLEAAANLRAQIKPQIVEVPVFTKADIAAIESIASRVDALASEVNGLMRRAREVKPAPVVTAQARTSPAARSGPSQEAERALRSYVEGAPKPTRSEPSSLGKAERSILAVLAQFGSSSKAKVAAIAGYAVGGGGFNNALGALRSGGLIVGSDPLEITLPGKGALGEFKELPTGQALVDYWCARLGRAEASILRVVCEAYPQSVDKEYVAQLTGYEANGGGFNNALGRLRTLELITRGQSFKASDHLFA